MEILIDTVLLQEFSINIRSTYQHVGLIPSQRYLSTNLKSIHLLLSQTQIERHLVNMTQNTRHCDFIMTIVYKLCLFNFRRVESLTLPLALNSFSMTSFRYCRKSITFSSVEERSLALRARANEPAIENTRSTPAEVAGTSQPIWTELDILCCYDDEWETHPWCPNCTPSQSISSWDSATDRSFDYVDSDLEASVGSFSLLLSESL